MHSTLNKSIEILERTPGVLHAMLQGLSADWIAVNEGPGTWSAYDIVGHLIHGEITDWMPRASIILSAATDKSFAVFDRFAQFNASKGKSLLQLLEEFEQLRKSNMTILRSKNIQEDQLQQKGIHPAFGAVTLSQLLATWVVHDLNHIAQICRAMAGHYKEDVGPWTAYLKILQ